MLNIEISEPAISDLRNIEQYTIEHYDDEQAERYFDLIDIALKDIASDPESIVARRILGNDTKVWARPLSASKRRGITHVQSPRHVIVYTLEYEGLAYVLRILHDSMDIEAQLEPHSE